MADLSGVWTADDGSTYYIRHRQPDVWWMGQSEDGSFYNGLEFTNVFHGTMNNDMSVVKGQWADVPRGRNMNFGDLTLAVDWGPNHTPFRLRKAEDSSGFGESRWMFQMTDPDRTFPSLGSFWGQIDKANWGVTGRDTLKDNLEIVKEPVVLYGQLACSEYTCNLPFYNPFPPNADRTFSTFASLNTWWDTGIENEEANDADMTCHILVDTTTLPPDLFEYMTPEHQTEVLKKIWRVHPEIVMFARHVQGESSPPLLPGWGEIGGDSVLVNGVPCDGKFEVDVRQGVTSMGEERVTPRIGQGARVTGLMAFDTGHQDRQLEIHPVYAIDIITATSVRDRSGVWGDSGNYTYYVHQIYNTIWMYVGSPFRGVLFAAVFQGEIQPDGVTVSGNWSTVPLTGANYGGQVTLQLDPGYLKIAISDDTPLFGGRVLQKLYDRQGHPCPSIGKVNVVVQGAQICEVKEVAGATVTYAAVSPGLASLPGIRYHWTAQGATIDGPDSESTVQVLLQGDGTVATVSVDITASTACEYHGERTFLTVNRQRANQMQLWCEIRQSAAATVTGSIAQARLSPPVTGTPMDLPDAKTLRVLEQSLIRMLEFVHELRDQRTK